jgi:hypothetical protein
MKIMTHTAETIKDILDRVSISREELDRVLKDRLDFGFDSIYFRYSEAIEELSYYKEMEARRSGEHFDRKRFCDTRKMHFYGCLEQLLRAHEDNNGLNS